MDCSLFSQVIEDPVEIIDTEGELRGFFNLEEDVKLVGYFKNENSRCKYCPVAVFPVLCNYSGLFSSVLCLSNPVHVASV